MEDVPAGKSADASESIIDFHLYSIDWSIDRIVWSVDGKSVRTLSRGTLYLKVSKFAIHCSLHVRYPPFFSARTNPQRWWTTLPMSSCSSSTGNLGRQCASWYGRMGEGTYQLGESTREDDGSCQERHGRMSIFLNSVAVVGVNRFTTSYIIRFHFVFVKSS